MLAPAVTTPLPGVAIAGVPVTAGRALHQFGYLTMEGRGADWTATLRDTEGKPVLTCGIHESRLSCPPQAP